MIEHYAASLVRHRARWSVVALVVFAAALAGGARLRLRERVTDFLPAGTVRDTTVAVTDADLIAVVVESPAAMHPGDVGLLADSIAVRLRRAPGIARAVGRLPWTPAALAGAFGSRLLLYFSPAELDTLRSHLTRSYMERALLHHGAPIPRSKIALAMGVERTDPLGVLGPALATIDTLADSPVKSVAGYLATPDQRDFFILVSPARHLATVDSATRVVRTIDSVIAGVRRDPVLEGDLTGRTLYAVGRPVAMVRGVALAVRDVQRVGIATTIVVLVLLIIFLRRVLAPLLMIGTVLYGVGLTSGVAYLLYHAIGLVPWLFIASLIGFGDEFALYVIAHYWLTASHTDRGSALASALRRPGPGILLGGLTSAAAFFSLIAISYPVMHQVAWLTTIGLLLILGCAFTVLPLVLAYTRPGRDLTGGWRQWGKRAEAVGQQRRGVWAAAWILLIVVAAWSARLLRYDLHPWNLALRGVPATADLERISERLGASVTPFTMISRGATLDDALDRDRAAVAALNRIRDDAGIAAIVSPGEWIPPAARQDSDRVWLTTHREELDPARVARDFDRVVQQMTPRDTLLRQHYLPAIAAPLRAVPQRITLATLDSLAGPVLTGQVTEEHGQYVVRSDVFPREVPWAPGVVERFTSAITRDTSSALRKVTFTSDALNGATRVDLLRRNAVLVIGLALLLTIAVLVIRFRSVSLVLLCLAPLLCGLAAVVVVMALAGVEVNMLTLAIAPLLIGLGSDDGIHIVDRLERRESVDEVLTDVSAPMVITTLTTIAGFACLAFASFPGVRETGIIAAIGLVVCLIASMQLVPMGYAWLGGGAFRQGRDEAPPDIGVTPT